MMLTLLLIEKVGSVVVKDARDILYPIDLPLSRVTAKEFTRYELRSLEHYSLRHNHDDGAEDGDACDASDLCHSDSCSNHCDNRYAARDDDS